MNIWLYFDEVGCFILMYDFEDWFNKYYVYVV